MNLALEWSSKDKPTKKRKQPQLPTNKLLGKSPNMDLDDGLYNTDESDEAASKKMYTRLALEKKRLGLSSKKYLAMLSKRSAEAKLEKKEEQDKKRKEREGTNELERMRKEAAIAKLSPDCQDIERSMDILPQAFKKGARRNVVQRVNNEIASFFPVTEFTELTVKEVTQLAKIRYMPKDLSIGYLMNQYKALQMIPVPGTKAKKSLLVERLNPQWMRERFTDKFLQLV